MMIMRHNIIIMSSLCSNTQAAIEVQVMLYLNVVFLVAFYIA